MPRRYRRRPAGHAGRQGSRTGPARRDGDVFGTVDRASERSGPMTRPLFTGVGVALVTLFDDGEVDAKATAEHAATLVDLGMRAVVGAGSTGEAASLTDAERTGLITEVRRAVPSDTPVLAGTGAPSRRQAAALTRAAADHGADGVLVLSPTGSRDLPRYYEAVAAAAGDLPVLGLKDSSGDPARLLHELTGYHGWLYVGSTSLVATANHLGATGAILALASIRFSAELTSRKACRPTRSQPRRAEREVPNRSATSPLRPWGKSRRAVLCASTSSS